MQTALLNARTSGIGAPAARSQATSTRRCKLHVVATSKSTTCEERAVMDRRGLIALVLPALMTLAGSAEAGGLGKDPKKLLREKEARKAKLREVGWIPCRTAVPEGAANCSRQHSTGAYSHFSLTLFDVLVQATAALKAKGAAQ